MSFRCHLPSPLLCLRVFALSSRSTHPYFQPFSSRCLKSDDFVISPRKTLISTSKPNRLYFSSTPNHNQNARTEARRNTEDSTRNCAPRMNYTTFINSRSLAALYTLANILSVGITVIQQYVLLS